MELFFNDEATTRIHQKVYAIATTMTFKCSKSKLTNNFSRGFRFIVMGNNFQWLTVLPPFNFQSTWELPTNILNIPEFRFRMEGKRLDSQSDPRPQGTKQGKPSEKPWDSWKQLWEIFLWAVDLLPCLCTVDALELQCFRYCFLEANPLPLIRISALSLRGIGSMKWAHRLPFAVSFMAYF